jgi:DNA-binding winged helix-turn-helix (wHTH) protein
MKLQIGDFTFDGDARQLLRGGVPVHLSPKAFELLTVLLEERPRALAKGVLQERLWPGAFVHEANLPNLIAELRSAFADDARKPRFIRTAQRFGYAFCGDVDERRAAAEVSDVTFCWLLKEGQRIALRSGENIIGRDIDDGIRVESPTVSRRHARIVVSDGGATLEDLESKNGTLLRGRACTGVERLTDGDEIRAGAVALKFRMTTRGGATATWSEGTA